MTPWEAWLAGYQSGAQAAVDFIVENWPDLPEAESDLPPMDEATMEHITRVVELARRVHREAV